MCWCWSLPRRRLVVLSVLVALLFEVLLVQLLAPKPTDLLLLVAASSRGCGGRSVLFMLMLLLLTLVLVLVLARVACVRTRAVEVARLVLVLV